MAFLTDAEFREVVAARLQRAGGGAALEPWQQRIAAEAHDAGARDVYNELRKLGLSDAAARSFPRGGEFERDQSLYWFGKHDSFTKEYDQKAVDALNRLAELRSLVDAGGGPNVVSAAGALDDSGDAFSRSTRW